MGYGFKLLKADGSVAMSTEEFGIQIVDDFVVSSGSSGSQEYPELSYHTTVFATTMSDIPSGVDHIKVSGHSFMDISITVDGSNIPTVSWTTSNAAGALIGDGIFSMYVSLI